MLRKLKDNKGFTLIELLMVFIVLGILAQISMIFTIDLRSRSSDIMAVADGRNLITLVRNNFVNLDDVDYTQIDGSDVGVETTGGDARPPVFALSPGVKVFVIPGSKSDGTPGGGKFHAYLSHINGTTDAAGLNWTGTGKREFYYVADETTDPPSYSLATF